MDREDVKIIGVGALFVLGAIICIPLVFILGALVLTIPSLLVGAVIYGAWSCVLAPMLGAPTLLYWHCCLIAFVMLMVGGGVKVN